jgi:hypothetical protein
MAGTSLDVSGMIGGGRALRQEGDVYRPVVKRSRPPSGGPCLTPVAKRLAACQETGLTLQVHASRAAHGPPDGETLPLGAINMALLAEGKSPSYQALELTRPKATMLKSKLCIALLIALATATRDRLKARTAEVRFLFRADFYHSTVSRRHRRCEAARPIQDGRGRIDGENRRFRADVLWAAFHFVRNTVRAGI